MFWTILFYAVCAVGALLFVGLLYYRIDWARHPEEYKDLMVRVAGYSALFTPLDKALQDDIIARTEHSA